MAEEKIRRGVFVTFEGGDGCGKTTQAGAVRALLMARGHDVLRTREPGGTALGQQIRQMLLGGESLTPRTETLLFAADRAHHIATVVRPALDAGVHVLQDRYLDSSVAYQGAGRALDPQQILDLSLWAAEGLLPDLTVLLDLDPVEAAARVGDRGAADRIEAEQMEFKVRLREGFLAIAASDPERFLVVDASTPVGEITRQVSARITSVIEDRS